MTRYPRVIVALENEFKKERNETYETFQLLARKQHIGDSLEQFHSVLSGLAARCNFGDLETRILRDVFSENKNNREAQNEMCRSTKTPGEVYRIALSYERGDKYAQTYVSTTGGTTASGSFRRGADLRGGASKRCYNCDQPNFPNFTKDTWQDVWLGVRPVIFVRRLITIKKLAGESVLTEEGLRWDWSRTRRIWIWAKLETQSMLFRSTKTLFDGSTRLRKSNVRRIRNVPAIMLSWPSTFERKQKSSWRETINQNQWLANKYLDWQRIADFNFYNWITQANIGHRRCKRQRAEAWG